MRIKGLLAAAAAAVVLSGCTVKPAEDTASSGESAADTGSESAAVIVAAPTNGAEGMDVTREEYLGEYLYFLSKNGYSADTDEDSLAQAQQQVIDSIIEEKIIRAKFAEYGMEITDSEKEDIRSDVESGTEAIKSSLREAAEAADSTLTDEELDSRAEEQYQQLLSTCGISEDTFYNWQEAVLMKQKLTDMLSESAGITDEELSSQLQALIAAAKSAYEEDPENYSGQTYAGLWIPEGSRKVQGILIGFDYDTYSQIVKLRSDGDDEGADSFREESLDSLAERYQEVMARIVAGDDFAELMEEFNEDEGNGTFLITPGTGLFGSEILECAMGIDGVGGTDTAVTDYGYYILRYAEDAVVSDETLNSTADSLREYLLEEKRTELFNTELEKWKNEYSYEIRSDLLGI